MFWRAARGRVGPNSRSVLHMAIFLLNPYGLYACILIPKLLASSPEMAGPASPPELSKLARKARMPLTLPKAGVAYANWCQYSLRSHWLKAWHVVFKTSYGHPLHIFDTRFARIKPRPRTIGPVSKERRSECGHLTYIKKYDIIFKKRICVRRWRLGHLTILKKCDIINKKTSTANRHQRNRIWLDFHKKL